MTKVTIVGAGSAVFSRQIITDSGTSGEVVAACEEQGVEVEVVSTEGAGRVSAGPSARSGRP